MSIMDRTSQVSCIMVKLGDIREGFERFIERCMSVRD